MPIPGSSARKRSSFCPRVAWVAFVAGFLATLVFHQGMLEVLRSIGLTQRIPFAIGPVAPLSVPGVVSLGFWGGLWGVALAYADSLLAHHPLEEWVFALLFGALAPSIGGWFVSAPLHGLPLGGGWHLPEMLTSLLVNAAWGLGTALLLRLWFARHGEASFSQCSARARR